MPPACNPLPAMLPQLAHATQQLTPLLTVRPPAPKPLIPASPAQAIVRPYLESKYSVVSSGRRLTGVAFRPDLSFRRWLAMWMEQLVGHYASGEPAAEPAGLYCHPQPAALMQTCAGCTRALLHMASDGCRPISPAWLAISPLCIPLKLNNCPPPELPALPPLSQAIA